MDKETYYGCSEDSITINITGNTIDWSTISIVDVDNYNIDLNNITTHQPIEFEDTMPSVAKVEDMCNNYPALAKAYENFKTIYAMSHQDWVGRQKQDESPF